MANIQTNPITGYVGPFGGYGTAGGFIANSSDGSKVAAGGVLNHVTPYGNQISGAGLIAAGPEEIVGVGAVAFDTMQVDGKAKGGFHYDRSTGELDAKGSAVWYNEMTGEAHQASAVVDLQKGQGGSITVNKDGEVKTYEIPPRPQLQQ